MHKTQERLLQLAEKKNLADLTLREMGELIGEPGSPQRIKHHFSQLQKKGLIKVDKIKGTIEPTDSGWVKGFAENVRLLAIPIVGSANCGPAELLADQNITGYLRISNTLLDESPIKKELYALKAKGLSMNRANVNEKNIEDGDYLIVDRSVTSPKDGDVVVSIIDGMANVKKFVKDKDNNQIVLLSESTHETPPIHIHAGDEYFVNGKVVQVIKKPKN